MEWFGRKDRESINSLINSPESTENIPTEAYMDVAKKGFVNLKAASYIFLSKS